MPDEPVEVPEPNEDVAIKGGQIPDQTDTSFLQPDQFDSDKILARAKTYLDHFSARMAAIDDEITMIRSRMDKDAKILKNDMSVKRYIDKVLDLIARYEAADANYSAVMKQFNQDFLAVLDITQKMKNESDATKTNYDELNKSFGVIMTLLRPHLKIKNGKPTMDELLEATNKLITSIVTSTTTKETDLINQVTHLTERVLELKADNAALQKRLDDSIPVNSIDRFLGVVEKARAPQKAETKAQQPATPSGQPKEF